MATSTCISLLVVYKWVISYLNVIFAGFARFLRSSWALLIQHILVQDVIPYYMDQNHFGICFCQAVVSCLMEGLPKIIILIRLKLNYFRRIKNYNIKHVAIFVSFFFLLTQLVNVCYLPYVYTCSLLHLAAIAKLWLSRICLCLNPWCWDSGDALSLDHYNNFYKLKIIILIYKC